tara:strand:+ start:252 stop:1133 length:882 start_codon:yes stop_codon:yes gene_type:complete
MNKIFFKKLFSEIFIRKIKHLLFIITNKFNGKFVNGFLVNTGNYKYIVPEKDMFVGYSLRHKGFYGKDEFNRIKSLINSNSKVIFIGAHIGSLSIPTSKHVKEVICIEANPDTYELLNYNLILNKINNCITYNIAIGEKEGKIDFLKNSINSGGSKRKPHIKNKIYYYDKPKIIKVQMTTLDKLLSNKIEFYDFVYIDIEGSEYFALNGMSETIKRIKSLVIEFFPHHLKNVSNTSVSNFFMLIKKHFNYCYVPSKNIYLTKNDFIKFFEEMYNNNENDDGLIFSNHQINFNK